MLAVEPRPCERGADQDESPWKPLRPGSSRSTAAADEGRLRGVAITQLISGVPVTELDASIDWYTRFFGRPPDLRAGDEVLWDISESATLFIEPNAKKAGSGRVTFAVEGLDALLEGLAAARIEYEPIETYSNGVRHVKIPDPDGNALAFAEPPVDWP